MVRAAVEATIDGFMEEYVPKDFSGQAINTCEPFTTLVDYKKCPKGWGKKDLKLRPTDYESVSDPQTTAYHNS